MTGFALGQGQAVNHTIDVGDPLIRLIVGEPEPGTATATSATRLAAECSPGPGADQLEEHAQQQQQQQQGALALDLCDAPGLDELISHK